MGRVRYLIGFAPWLVFGAFDAHHVREAALAALVVAVLVSARALSRPGPKLVELATLAAFTVLALVAAVGGMDGEDFLAHYARAVPTGALAVATFLSLRATPLIEQYPRVAVAAEVANSPASRHRMRQFTLLWGAIFVAMAGSHVLAGALATPHANRLFNWAVPIGLVVVGVRVMRSGASRSAAGDRPRVLA